MSDLCRLWGVNQSRTTPYHPLGNGVVERNNRMLGDALQSLLLGRSQEEWDTVLPQVMRAYRSTPHTSHTPAYLKDFVCDCVQSGAYESLEENRVEKPSGNFESCEPHANINFCEGGVVGGINALGAKSSNHVQQTRCPAFSYADITKGRRFSQTVS